MNRPLKQIIFRKYLGLVYAIHLIIMQKFTGLFSLTLEVNYFKLFFSSNFYIYYKGLSVPLCYFRFICMQIFLPKSIYFAPPQIMHSFGGLSPERIISELLKAACFSKIVSLWQRWRLNKWLVVSILMI